jgi:hypothetical protein
MAVHNMGPIVFVALSALCGGFGTAKLYQALRTDSSRNRCENAMPGAAAIALAGLFVRLCLLTAN